MKEDLKLALEALEDSEDHLAKPYSTDARRAIAAIKAALAQEQCQCPECQIKPHTSDCAVHSEPAYPRGGCNCGAQPVAVVLPPIVEPTTKSEPVYIMGSYVGTGEVSSVTLGGVSFAGNGTAGREADVKPTGFFFQMPKPEQKPVAWIKIRELSYMKAVAEHGKYDWQTNLGLKPEPDDEGLYTETQVQRMIELPEELLREEYKRGYADAMGWKVQNHLEHLPPQPWTDLTDDEVVHLKMLGRDLEFVSMTALRRFAKDIESKLKEKNYG